MCIQTVGKVWNFLLSIIGNSRYKTDAMKRSNILFAILIFLAATGILSAQEGEQAISRIHNAIKAGSADGLAAFFHSTVDLELGDTDGNFSRNQAEMIVRDFFTKNPVKAFTVKHQGSSDDGSKYSIGLYVSKSNEEFRVYILLKQSAEGLRINQLQFEKE